MAESSGPELGIENHNAIYLLRTAQQHHVHLSAMADQKANFLLAGSFVALSVVISGVANQSLTFTYTLLALSVTAALSSLFAVLAVMPRFSGRRKDDREKNLLFFGEMGGLEFDEYWEQLRPTLLDSEATLRAMAKDLFEIGSVLRSKKYRYLNLSYRSFLLGLILTVLVAVAEKYYL